jgi:acetate kinase
MTRILTINGGSSSIRFALFEIDEASGARKPGARQPGARKPERLLDGKVERIGTPEAAMTLQRAGQRASEAKIDAAKPESAVDALAARLQQEWPDTGLQGIGHRVVHGMQHMDPQRVTPELLAELKQLESYDPEHLPREIHLIEIMQQRYPHAPQAVCFDTAFHRNMPQVARRLAIPRKYFDHGVQRYGFHGLSYTYLLAELGRLGDPAASRGRVILAHLGGGASLAAVRDGQSIDTSMAFTPTAGLVMSTRSGDLDPGVLTYLLRAERFSAQQLQTLVNHQSGLIGIAESSGDVQDLLKRESSDVRAREALDIFCYQAKKWIGSFAAALGGLDTLVFAGGIGENSAVIRERICAGLDHLGVQIDPHRNEKHDAVISAPRAAATVRVIRTDEESVIADATARVLGLTSSSQDTTHAN